MNKSLTLKQMGNIAKQLCILLFFVISTQNLYSQEKVVLSDQAQVSLLTNSPWDKEIYALFGHTALRVNDPLQQLDVVFNYGIFDFDSPNFMYRFVKGETDYWVAPMSFNSYMYSYKTRGVGIVQQILNLNQTEKQNIFDALVTNCLPENKIYRYNYFYDNCSTRPRDIVSNNIDGKIIYKTAKTDQSFRDLLDLYLKNQPWVKFGIDLVIGADADKIITDRQKDFLPQNLEQSFRTATIKTNEGLSKELVKETIILNKSQTSDNATSLISPTIAGFILLIIYLFISILNLKNKSLTLGKIADSILFFIAGLAGCIIFFLMFFTEHPCTNPNWNIIWLNPIQLIFACLFLIKPLIKYIYYYHFINFVLLSVLFLAWFLIPQQMNLSFIPYIIALWMRSGVNIIEYKKNRKNIKN